MAEERRLRKLSQAKIASDLNISQSAYADYETGRSEPSLEMFTSIAVKLEVTPHWLVFGEGEKEVSGLEIARQSIPVYLALSQNDELFAEVAGEVERVLRELSFFHRDAEFLTLCALNICKTLRNTGRQEDKPIPPQATLSEVSWLRQKILNGLRRTRIDVLAGIDHE